MLFVEHDMDIVERFAERVVAFYSGRIIADGAPREALADATTCAATSPESCCEDGAHAAESTALHVSHPVACRRCAA